MAVPGTSFGAFPSQRRFAQSMRSPLGPEPDVPGHQDRSASYRVARGDTLSGLAQQAGLDMDTLIGRQSPELAARLRENPDLIYEDEELTMPEGFRPAPRAAETRRSAAETSKSFRPAPVAPPRFLTEQTPTGDPRHMLEMGSYPGISGLPVGSAPRSIEASIDMDEVARQVQERFWPTMRAGLGAGVVGGVALGTGGMSLAGQTVAGGLGGAAGEAVAGGNPVMGAAMGAAGPVVGRGVQAGLGSLGRAAGLLPDPQLPPPVPMTPRAGMGPNVGVPPPTRGPSVTVDMMGTPGSPSNPVPLPGTPAPVGAPAAGPVGSAYPGMLGRGRVVSPPVPPADPMLPPPALRGPGLGGPAQPPIAGMLDEGVLPPPPLATPTDMPGPAVGPGRLTLEEAMARVGVDPALPPVRPVTLGGGATPRPQMGGASATVPGRLPASGVGPDDFAFANEPTLVRGGPTRILADAPTMGPSPVPAPLPAGGGEGLDPRILAAILGTAGGVGVGVPAGLALRPAPSPYIESLGTDEEMYEPYEIVP